MLKNQTDRLRNPINFVTEVAATASLPISEHGYISDVGFSKEKLRSQTFFEMQPDCYCTFGILIGNSLIQDFMEHAEPTPPFFLLDTNITPI
jgi:hypothetical protein